MTQADDFRGFGSGRPTPDDIAAAREAGLLPLDVAPIAPKPVAVGGPEGRRARRRAELIDSGKAWWVVVAAVFSTLTAFFVTYSFTTFFGAMSEEFDSGDASTSLLFSLTIGFLFILGLPAGKASDRWGPRPVVLFGAAVLVAGLLLTSRVQRLEVGYLTYGLAVGLGVACCYVPVVSQVTGWFEQRRAVALGIAVSGIGVGTTLGPRLSQALIDEVGWRDAYEVLAVCAAAGFLVAAALIKPAPAMANAETFKLRTLASSKVFRAMYLSGFLMSLGLFVPFLYLKPYAEDNGIGAGDAALLLSVLGIGSLAGRLLLGTFAGRMGLMRLYQMCFIVLAASFVIWLAAGGSWPALAAFAFVLGVAYGGYVALSPAAAAELFGLVGLGSTLGAMYTAGGFGGLLGPPLAGLLQDTTDTYTWSIVAAGVTAVVGVLVLRRAIRLAA